MTCIRNHWSWSIHPEPAPCCSKQHNLNLCMWKHHDCHPVVQWWFYQHYCFNRGVFVHLLLSVEQNIHDAAETKKLTVLTWSLFGGEMFIFSPFLICIYIGKVDRNYLLINLRPNTNRNKSRLEHLLIKMKYYFSFTCKCKSVWPTLKVL